MNVQKN
jgi:catalase